MYTELQQQISSNILKILREKGLSQAELSRRTELDPASLSKIINGEAQLKVNTLSKIATALEMSVVDLITWPDHYVPIATGEQEPLEAILQIRLRKEKKNQILQLIFGEHNLEILNN
ncbi:MAG: helix-turn-helix transcriptional regulator [Bacteroidales bacterium]|nr:helix-turn-helix transcriptional regulator [Bacteroidales bacterium]